MKLTIAKEDLNHALRRVQGATLTRTTLQALYCVLIRAAGERVEFTASNLDLQISHSVKSSVALEGSALLTLGKFMSFVSELGPQEVGLESDAKFRAKIGSGGAVCQMSGIDPTDFPTLLEVDSASFTIPQQALKSAIRRTIFSVSDEETRVTLNGVLLKIEGGKLNVASTDGRRLSLVTLDLDAPDAEAIIPTKTCSELARLLGDEGDVKISLSRNAAKFEIGDTVLVSKLIEGIYPNYRQVIPSQCGGRVTVSREELRSIIRLANVATDEKNCGTNLKFGRHNLSAEGSGNDTSASTSMAVKHDGPDFTIKLQGEFLLEVLNALDDDEVHLEWTDALSPFVVKGNEFLAVIMPLRPG